MKFLQFLKSNYKDDAEVETLFDNVIALFKYLQDKDVFENYYKINLSKRLLLQRMQPAQQQETEKLFITKLKRECGHGFTSKIEGMLNDMRLSRDNMELFREHKVFNLKDPSIDLNVNILTASFWPAYTIGQAALPAEMESCCTAFAAYYNDAHSGRKITWQKNLGDGVMIARFPFGKHEIVATTHQMIVLLVFNRQNELTYKELQNATQIPDKDLKRCLGKNKLLSKEFKTKTVEDEEKFQWNAKFKSSTIRIKVSGYMGYILISPFHVTESREPFGNALQNAAIPASKPGVSEQM